MKVGDKVFAEVARDKERGGTLVLLKDSDALVEFENDTRQVFHIDKVRPIASVAIKHDAEKVRLELIPVSGIEGIGRAMTFGSKKYADHNWANGFNWSRLCGSAMRHLVSWMSGEDKDPESGLSHLDHLGACVVMLIAHETEELGNDDRRKTNV